MLRDVHALWIGPDLPPRAAGCLNSFARAGHRVVLHSYARLAGVPDTITTDDADAIVPRQKIFRRVGAGQYAIFADYFRYKLLTVRDCLWVDCDVYCVRPIDIDGDHVFGLEDETVANTAVLKLPPDSAVLEAMIALYEGPAQRPAWMPQSAWLKTRIKAALHRTPWVAAAPWGATGPNAFSYLVAKEGVAAQAQPPAVFYPVPWRAAHVFARAGEDIARFLTPATRTIHLWNEITRLAGAEPEPGSLLDRIAREGAGAGTALTL